MTARDGSHSARGWGLKPGGAGGDRGTVLAGCFSGRDARGAGGGVTIGSVDWLSTSASGERASGGWGRGGGLQGLTSAEGQGYLGGGIRRV